MAFKENSKLRQNSICPKLAEGQTVYVILVH